MRVVADTHALHWHVASQELLGKVAREILQEAESNETEGIVVSVASHVDLHYLVAKGQLEAAQAQRIWAVTSQSDTNIRAMAVTPTIVERFGDQALTDLPDPWDRFIVSTAIDLGVPLVTKDRAITRLAGRGVIEVIW